MNLQRIPELIPQNEQTMMETKIPPEYVAHVTPQIIIHLIVSPFTYLNHGIHSRTSAMESIPPPPP